MRNLLRSPLCITLAVVLLGWVTQSLQAFDHVYWNVWYKNVPREVDAKAALISLDGGAPISPSAIAASTARQAELLRRVMAARPHHVYLDLPLAGGSDPAGDAALGRALQDYPSQITLVRRSTVEPTLNLSVPLPEHFRVPASVPVAISAWDVNFVGYAQRTKAAGSVASAGRVRVDGHEALTLRTGVFYPDFAFDPRQVPVHDGRAVLNSGQSAGTLAGRDVFITNTYPGNETALGYFGAGEVPAALVDLSSMRSLAKGRMIDLGSLPLALAFAALCLTGRWAGRRRTKALVYVGGVAAIFLLPGFARGHGIILSIGPALAALLIYAPLRLSQKWRSRVQHTSSASGLPNIAALAVAGIPRSQDVVAVSISQYDHMLASIPREHHGECARQIARRLALGAGDRQIFDNANGHFVWLEDSRTLERLVAHLEGLRALFSSPIIVDGVMLDTTVHFGIDRNGEASSSGRRWPRPTKPRARASCTRSSASSAWPRPRGSCRCTRASTRACATATSGWPCSRNTIFAPGASPGPRR